MSAYQVGIELNLINHASAGLLLLSGQLTKTAAEAKALQASLLGIGKMAALGGGLLAGGLLGLNALSPAIDAAKKYQTEMARFKALGLGDHINSEADKVARGMNIIGASSLETMKMLKEATTITGSFAHAAEVTPTMLKMKFGIESVMAGHGEKFDSQIQAVLKTAELRGALINRQTGQMDMGKFTGALDQMTKAYVASGGLVKPSDYLQAIKTGGVSTKLMNDASFYGLGHFIQESGGSRTGTSLMSMFQNWQMGRMPLKIMSRMMDLGLLDSKGVHYDKHGHVKAVDIGSLKNSQQFIDNPFKYVNDVVVPLLKAKGYSGDTLNMQLAGLFGQRTASNLADTMVREQKVAELYNQRMKKAVGIDGLYKAGSATMQGKELDYEAKKNKLLTELGIVSLPLVCKGLDLMIKGVTSLNNFVQKNPELVKNLMWAFIGLFGAMAFSGTVLLIASGFRLMAIPIGFIASKGLAAAGGLGAVTSALGTLAAAAAAFSGGYAFGSWIDKKTGISSKIGGAVYDFMNASQRDPSNVMRLPSKTSARGYSVVPYKGSNGTTVHTQINIDGHKVAQAVSHHQSKAANRATSTGRSFDHSRAVPAAGMGA